MELAATIATTLLGFLVVIGLPVAMLLLAIRTQKRRTAAFAAWANTRSFAFEPRRPEVVGELASFRLFQRGERRAVSNYAAGRADGCDVRIFDYSFQTGSEKNSQTHNQTVCVVDGDARHDVHFFCRRQNTVFDAIGKLFGGQDVNFDEDPAFSKAFVLQTNGDEARLRTFMSPRLRALLVELAADNIMLEVAGGRLVLHMGRCVKPEEIDDLVDVAVRVRGTFA